jgi:hypothetical protein
MKYVLPYKVSIRSKDLGLSPFPISQLFVNRPSCDVTFGSECSEPEKGQDKNQANTNDLN